MELPTLYTPSQVADYLQVARGTVYSLVSRGEIESVKVGRNRRFTADHIRHYIKRKGAVIIVDREHMY